MQALERLLAESGSCQITLDPLTADRAIRALGQAAGILVGLEFMTADRAQSEAMMELREELAALRQILLIGRRLGS